MIKQLKELAEVEYKRQLNLNPEKHAKDIVDQVVTYHNNPRFPLAVAIEEHFGV